jgi:predicted NUDIX family NTP pyrophosphohydrolase
VPKSSAGILLYRRKDGGLEVFLVHPGGPFWVSKDHGAWSIPKGLFEEDEDPLAAARREFLEETGFELKGAPHALTPRRQASGKIIHAWAVEGELDASQLRSNTFTMEWPKGSGKVREFPEVDRGEWFALAEAKRRLQPGQVPFLEELEERFGGAMGQ